VVTEGRFPITIKISAYPKCFEYEIGLYHRMTVFDWISIAKNHLEVEGLEMYDRFFTSLDRDYLVRVRKAANQAGFTIPMLICSPDFTHPDPEERRRAIEYQRHMIEVAAFLGEEGVICRTLSGQQRPEVSREQGIKWVVDAIQQVIPTAKEFGVILGMENHYKDSQWVRPEFALKQDVFLEIIQAIEERRYFGVQYDPSNAIIAGDDPIALLEKVIDRVVSMHASDRRLKEGVTVEQFRKIEQGDQSIGYSQYLAHGVIGKGLNDYDKIFSILSKSGFNGWVSIEDGVNGLDEIKESLTFLKQMRSKYYHN
jgi:sugar phosphate isomerase/epimerase